MFAARDIVDGETYRGFTSILAKKHGMQVYQHALKAVCDTCTDSWTGHPCAPDFPKAAEALAKQYNDDWGT